MKQNSVKTILCLFLLITIANITATNRTLCCDENDVLVFTEENHLCFNGTSNETTPMNVLQCKNFVIGNNGMFNFTINSNDQLEVTTPDRLFVPDPYEIGSFCVHNAFFYEPNATFETIVASAAVICFEEITTDPIILAYCMIVSCVFLTITAIIYAVIPELRDLQGKSFISLCASLGIAYVVYGITVFAGVTDSTAWCAIGAFVEYFSFISAFFWMNAIAIQVLKSVRRVVWPDYGWREYGWYALYAWGCSALLTLCVILANYIPGKHLVPGIGMGQCWFFRKKEQWAYMYSIEAILLFANVTIFVYCSTMLWRHRFSSSNIKALRYKFCMSFRLLIVMGLTWIFDLASVAHGKYHVVWVIMDLINTLQGVLFFVILVLLRLKAIKALNKRGLLCCMSGFVERYLAKTDDAEGVANEHTMVFPMDEPK